MTQEYFKIDGIILLCQKCNDLKHLHTDTFICNCWCHNPTKPQWCEESFTIKFDDDGNMHLIPDKE